MTVLGDSGFHWAVPAVSTLLIAIATTIFVLRRRFSNQTYVGEKVTYSIDENDIAAAELDYSELQRNLNEGVHALDHVRDNVQTLFSGVHGAQVLHSEVENCVSSLAEEIAMSASSETTVGDLEKLLENETRSRWALTVSHEKEIKAISSKCQAFEVALNTLREKYDVDLLREKQVLESIIRAKEDELKNLEELRSDQMSQVSILQNKLDENKLEIEALKAENASQKKTMELAAQESAEAESARVDEVIRQKGAEFESTISLLTQNFEKQIAELNEQLASYKNLKEAAEQQKDTFAETLEQSVAAVSQSKDAEIARIQEEHEKTLSVKQAELDAFLLELALVNDSLQQQSKSFDERFKAEMDAALSNALDQQANTFDERLKTELNAQAALKEAELEVVRLSFQSKLASANEAFEDQLALKESEIDGIRSEFDSKLSWANEALIEQTVQFDERLKSELDALMTVKDTELNAIRLDFQSKLNEALDEQSKLFSESLKTALDEQAVLYENQLTVLRSTCDALQNQLETTREMHDSDLLQQKEFFENLILAKDDEIKVLEELRLSQGRELLEAGTRLEESKVAIETLEAENADHKKAIAAAAESSSESAKVQAEFARVEEAIQQKTSEFESTISLLIQNYEAQISELNELLASHKNLAEDAEQRERAFAETLQESLAAVNKSKDSEIACIHQEYKKALAVSQTELDAARLDFQSKLTSANKALEQQAKSFEERLKAELDAQTSCSSQRLQFSEMTICNLQEELQRCRSEINQLNAEIKLLNLKADGAGVLLDRVHTYKTQLDCSGQEKSELLQSLESRDKDLIRLNEKLKDKESVIQEFEYSIREYEIELNNHVDALNLAHSAYSSKLAYLEACLEQHSVEHHRNQGSMMKVIDEENLRQQIEQLQASISKQQDEFISALDAMVAVSNSKIAAIEEAFEKEKSMIAASRDELSNALNESNVELDRLRALSVEKQNEIEALHRTFEDRICVMTDQFASDTAQMIDNHTQQLEALKSEHETRISQLIEASTAEQLVMIEKAKTETAKDWQALMESSEAIFQKRLETAVDAMKSAMQTQNESAVRDAVQHEKALAQERLDDALKELHELYHQRITEANEEWQTKFDLQRSLAESLQAKLDQLDRFHKPKSKAVLGERDPLTGSRPGASSHGPATKRGKNDSKENAPAGDQNDRPGHSSDSVKTVSSRGSRSRSRRDSQGHRYWKASDFQFKTELGQGTFGIHYLAIENKTSNQYVINKISRKKVEKSHAADVLIQRIEMMGQLMHPYIRRMLGSFEDDRWIYIVQEHIANAKPLSSHLHDLLQKKYVFPPSDVAFLMSCLANALDYVHGKGLVHCQVAIHKVLLTSYGIPKLAGPTVGFSNLPVPPPECLKDGPSSDLSWAVDSWSLGVLAFTLLVGRVPFSVNDSDIDLNLVAKEPPIFSSHSDPLAKSLIESLLCKDPAQRPTMSQVLVHPFILHYQRKEPLSTIREDQRLS